MAKQTRRRRKAEQTESRALPTTNKTAHKASTANTADANTNPWEPMERLMQAFMPFGWMRPWMGTMPTQPTPKLDLIDREDEVLVRAEVPGVQKNRLEVEASDVAVTIKGEVQHEETREDAEGYHISETSRGVFARTVRLPADVDSTRAKATFKDGVVEVMLPKVDRSRSHHVKL